MHTVLQNTVCPGARTGEFLLGADEFLGGAGGRDSETVRRGFSGVGKRLRLRCNPPENGFSVDKNFYFCRHLRPIRRSLSEKPVPRAPRRDLPRRKAPSFAYGVANTVRPGARAGEFLLGKDGSLIVAHGRVSETGRWGVSEVGE